MRRERKSCRICDSVLFQFNYCLGLGCNEFGDYCDGSENQVEVEPGEEKQVEVEPGEENQVEVEPGEENQVEVEPGEEKQVGFEPREEKQVGFEPRVENTPGSRFRRNIPNSHLAKGEIF